MKFVPCTAGATDGVFAAVARAQGQWSSVAAAFLAHQLRLLLAGGGPKGPPSAPPAIPPIIINPYSYQTPAPAIDPRVTPTGPPIRPPRRPDLRFG